MNPDPVQRLDLSLGERGYEIVVGEELLTRSGEFLAPVLGSPRVVIVSDENVAALYLEPLRDGLTCAGITCHDIVLPAGEATKDFRHLMDLLDRLLTLRTERQDTIVALGGGVVGDLAGFAASIFLRGIDVVQVPTTLLAQVDSSVGGKTGINTRFGKNLVGTFHQPRLVLADAAVLESLPERQVRAGYAEVVKYGLIDDVEFFEWLERNGAAVCSGDRRARRHAVSRSCAAKARIVAEDERESGKRALLNLGHTFAHAVEVEMGFGDRLLHGEAVAVGMVLAFTLSARVGLCPIDVRDRVHRHLAAVGLPTDLRAAVGDRYREDGIADSLIEHLAQDKKVRDGRAAFVLAHGIGRAFVDRSVDMSDVRSVLLESLAATAPQR